MANFIEQIGKAPKWLLISVSAVVLGLLGYGFYYLAFGMNKPKEEVPETVLLDMPDANEETGYGESALSEFEKGKYHRNNVSDYWDSLDEEEESKAADPEEVADNLDPKVFSDYERMQIRNGIKTKDQIDREHAEAEARRQELENTYATAGGSGYSSQQSRPLTQAQQDSLYMNRLERAYRMAAKYSARPADEEASDQQKPDSREEPERKLDLDEEDESILPVESFVDDGIITSLDEPVHDGVTHYGNGVKVKPVKATFLKNERLVSGNRVILRLMQDMTLADGTVIPANTHVTGTCAIGRRMKINVTMLHYGGRMFPVDISVYDNDGTEGIYCPLVEEASSAKKRAKKVAEGVVSSAGTLVGTLVTGNPLVGSLATNGIRSATSSVSSDGTVSVDVAAGYEFYLYENVKEKN